jgi:hypothetical protein
VIKALAEGEHASDHPITEADKGTVTIRDTLNKLDQQVEAIEKQIERYVTLISSTYLPTPLLSIITNETKLG